MTPEEARNQLDASTLRPQDATPEAREQTLHDHGFQAWLEKRQSFDEKVSSAMGDSVVPDGLKERLLAMAEKKARPTETPPRRKGNLGLISILAGALAIALVAAFFWRQENGEMPLWEKQSLAMVNAIDTHSVHLDHFSSQLPLLKDLLGKAGFPVPVSLPQGVSGMTSLGCKKFEIAGKPASVICFDIGSGKEAHLVTMQNEGLSDIPPQLAPQFVQRGDWKVAMWSHGDQSFILATKAEQQELLQLFTISTRSVTTQTALIC